MTARVLQLEDGLVHVPRPGAYAMPDGKGGWWVSHPEERPYHVRRDGHVEPAEFEAPDWMP